MPLVGETFAGGRRVSLAPSDPDRHDLAGPVLAARLASLLRTSRRDAGRTVRQLAHASGGAFTVSLLRRLEAAEQALDDLDLVRLTGLYGIDLPALLLPRVPLVVDAEGGRLETAGIVRSFDPTDPDGLLVAYLLLVRELRTLQHAPSISLRRGEVETLAASLRTDGETVLDRLGELMGSTVAQRRSMVAAFVAGAAIIVLAGGAVAQEPSAPVEEATLGGLAPLVLVQEDPEAAPTPAVAPTGTDAPADAAPPGDPDDDASLAPTLRSPTTSGAVRLPPARDDDEVELGEPRAPIEADPDEVELGEPLAPIEAEPDAPEPSDPDGSGEPEPPQDPGPTDPVDPGEADGGAGRGRGGGTGGGRGGGTGGGPGET
jgi:hypothetical protein